MVSMVESGPAPEASISTATIWEEPANTIRDMPSVIQSGIPACRAIIP